MKSITQNNTVVIVGVVGLIVAVIGVGLLVLNTTSTPMRFDYTIKTQIADDLLVDVRVPEGWFGNQTAPPFPVTLYNAQTRGIDADGNPLYTVRIAFLDRSEYALDSAATLTGIIETAFLSVESANNVTNLENAEVNSLTIGSRSAAQMTIPGSEPPDIVIYLIDVPEFNRLILLYAESPWNENESHAADVRTLAEQISFEPFVPPVETP